MEIVAAIAAVFRAAGRRRAGHPRTHRRKTLLGVPFPTQPFGSSLRPDWGDLSGLRPSQTEGLTRRKQLAGGVQAIHAADRVFAANT